jgi:SAM-dependent methyltransferase
MLYIIIAAFADYFIRNHYISKQKWDLNICCGDTNGGGKNADVIKRKVPNFVLLKNIYSLPFKDKQFENTICSHTIEHVEDPEKFFKELKRVSKNVVLLVPPIWD